MSIFEEIIEEEQTETIIGKWLVKNLGEGNCDEYLHFNIGVQRSGLLCAVACAEEGYWMASWNGNCLCE
jgi:hypothetical protein